MAYQSLYRRYRPQRFSEVRGQPHLVMALQNAVREGRVGHAYLLSGPRGTGKTSTARILAKVLNCTDVVDGEPCGVCASCVAIAEGTSFDVHELDAASNNGVEAVRDLVAKASLGTPGRTKVYILDEVHMLSAAASNALLKTLEEPPAHVVFVLATTDPQKVLPTIRSRCQIFEVRLLPASELEALVDYVAADAGLEISPGQRDHVLRIGAGSARDTLSALDRVVAAGDVPESTEALDEIVEAVSERDTGRALVAVEAAVGEGRSPRVLGEQLIARLRDVFLAAVGADLSRLTDTDRQRVADQASRLGPAGTTRALELLGEAFVGIQDAPDPRVILEVALVRLTRPEADLNLSALADRVARLERGGVAGSEISDPSDRIPARDTPDRPARAPAPEQGSGAGPPADEPTARTVAAGPAPASTPPSASTTPADPGPAPVPTTGGGEGPAADAREILARSKPSRRPKRSAPPPPPTVDLGSLSTEALAPEAPGPANKVVVEPGSLPTRDELTLAWGDTLLGSLSARAKPRFASGRFVRVDDDAAVFGLPNKIHAAKCEEMRGDVEAVLAAHFGRPVPLRVIIDAGGPPPADPQGQTPAGQGSVEGADGVDDDDVGAGIDPSELTDADDVAGTTAERISQAFPGAQLIELPDEG